MEKDVEKRYGIGKAKFGLAVCAILIVIFAVSSVWFYTELQNHIDLRACAYEGYVADPQHTNPESEAALFFFYYVTPEEQKFGVSNPESEAALFFFYYVTPEEQKFGVSNLDNELDSLEWTRPYEKGAFDCTEMTAYLERYLENRGWHAKIVVGDTPFGSGRHAWLLVETGEEKYMPIESTSIEIVWWWDPNFDNYLTYDHKFETISQALSYSETSFDWWTVYP